MPESITVIIKFVEAIMDKYGFWKVTFKIILMIIAWKTVIDASAENLEKIYVSGEKRGLDIGLKPQDLVKVLCAQFADVLDA